MKSLVFVFVFMSSISAQIVCGPDGGQVSIVGSSTVEPIARSWAEGYQKLCPNVIVNLGGGGSTVGARRVCNVTQPPADIGTMSRKWTPLTETNVTDDATGKYICNFGTKTRTMTQVDVAIDGITFILINVGLAAKCLRKLTGQGQGLTIDQLRWIYSNYTDPQKEATGWDKASIPFDDNNEATHNWNEIGGTNCPNAEIKLSSPGALSGTFSIFKEIVLPNSNEAIPFKRPSLPFISETNEELVTFVETSSLEVYGDGIGYVGFAFFVNEGTILYGVPIKNKGASVWIKPSIATIEDGTYVPFTRRLYMNIWDGTLVNTKPYIEYGLNQAGISLVRAVGYVALPGTELPCLAARVGAQIFSTITTNGTSPMTCILPTKSPTKQPTKSPTKQPTKSPTKQPTKSPTKRPTNQPTKSPTKVPTKRPTQSPTLLPIDTNDTCGLFGLNLFCPFTFCGVFGRFLGFCS